MSIERRIRFGFGIPARGTNKWDWRYSDAPDDAGINFGWYRHLASVAEAARIDFLFMNDGVIAGPDSPTHFMNRLEPLTILSALAGRTTHIGLVATVNCSFADPFTVARQFASLDVISGGRAGWNLVTGDVPEAAENFTDAPYLNHDERYDRADEHLAVVQGLWDSWEDDAFLYDRANRRFADTSKFHALDHKGRYFSVRGPLNISRSPQGQPVIFQAGTSSRGRAFAARHAGAIFSIAPSFEDARAYRADIHGQAAALGRPSGQPLIFPTMGSILGGTIEEAREKERAFLARPSIEEALDYLGMPFQYDFSRHDVDAPFPDIGDVGSNATRGYTDMVKRVAREKGYTLRETALRFANPGSRLVGTPETVADQVQHWFEQGAVDGFMLGGTGPEEFVLFTEQVLPILRSRGLAQEDYTHRTLRGHLGLDFPVNRYTAARLAQAGAPVTAA